MSPNIVKNLVEEKNVGLGFKRMGSSSVSKVLLDYQWTLTLNTVCHIKLLQSKRSNMGKAFHQNFCVSAVIINSCRGLLEPGLKQNNFRLIVTS